MSLWECGENVRQNYVLWWTRYEYSTAAHISPKHIPQTSVPVGNYYRPNCRGMHVLVHVSVHFIYNEGTVIFLYNNVDYAYWRIFLRLLINNDVPYVFRHELWKIETMLFIFPTSLQLILVVYFILVLPVEKKCILKVYVLIWSIIEIMK